MAVDTMEFDLLSVKIYHSVFYGDFPDSQAVHDHFILAFQNKGIKVRLLCIPKHRIIYGQKKATSLWESFLAGGQLPLGIIYQRFYWNVFPQKGDCCLDMSLILFPVDC